MKEKLQVFKKFFQEIQYVFWGFLVFKFILIFLGVLFYLIENDGLTGGALLDIFNKWDTVHYLKMATAGYTTQENDVFIHLVFFPLWPAVIWVFSQLFGDVMIAGLFSSNLFSLLAAIILFLMLKKDFGEKMAYLSTFLLFIFPVSYFFSMPYSESLYLFLTISFFHLIQKKYFFSAALAGFLAGNTRIFGIVLVLPYLVEYFSHFGLKIKKELFYLLIIPLGFFFYLYINFLSTGDYFAFLKIQKEHYTMKSAEIRNIFSLTWDGIKSLFSISDFNSYGIIYKKFEALFSFFGLVLVIASIKIRVSYFVYGLAAIVIMFSQNFWLSNTRYLVSIFPIFIVLAFFFLEKPSRLVLAFSYGIFSFSLMIFFFYRYLMGEWTLL